MAGAPSAAVTAAFDGLSLGRVRWAVLRGEVDPDERGDVDLLVDPDQADLVAPLLIGAGFARLSAWGHGLHRFYVAYEAEADRWAKLDVVSGLRFRTGHEVPEPVLRRVLERRATAGALPRLSAADEFWAQLLHCLLDRGRIRARDRSQLAELSRRGVEEGPLYELLSCDPAARASCAAVAAEEADAAVADLARLAERLSRCLPRRAGAEMRQGLARAQAPLMKAVAARGVSVAVLGPDGAGKSTLIAALARSFYLPARTFHLGLYGAHRPRLGPAGRLPGAVMVAQLARLWRAYAAAAYHRRRGRLVIYDRHGYEMLLPSRGRASTGRRLRRLLLGRLSPRPDLVVILDAPAEVLWSRKHEHTPEVLAEQRAAYRRLGQRLESRTSVAVVDAGQDAVAVRRQVTALIWRAFAGQGAATRWPG